jgi:hypothetical protein
MHTRLSVAAVLAVALVAVTAGAATVREDPAAVLVQLSGKVEVQRGSTTAAAAVGTALHAGDRLLVPGGGRAVIMYRTGRFQTATAAVTIEARQSDQPSGLYRQTLQTIAQVATTDAARQPNRQGMIRPVPGQAAPISPRNEIAVLDVRPAFVWFAVPGATSYTVQVQRTDLAGSRPLRWEVAADTTWTYPESAPPLVPGASYRWMVGSQGRASQPESFRVVSAQDFSALTQAFEEMSASGVDPSGDGLFVAALRFRDAGLFYEAERALADMARNGSGSGRAFHLLQAEVFDRLGLLESASASFQAADREPGL